MIREITVAKAGLRQLLSGVRPHMIARVKDEAIGRGVGNARLAASKEHLVATVVGRDTSRMIAARTPLLEAELADPDDIWLGANAVSAVVGLLEVSEAREVIVRVSSAWIEVREEGVVWGGRKIRVPRSRAPWSEDLIDPTEELGLATGLPVLARDFEILQAEDCRLFSKTCKALDQSLVVRDLLSGHALTYLWGGFGDAELADFVGVSAGPIVGDPEVSGELAVMGTWPDTLRQVPILRPDREEPVSWREKLGEIVKPGRDDAEDLGGDDGSAA